MRQKAILLGLTALVVAGIAAVPSLVTAGSGFGRGGFGRGEFAETPLGRLVTGQIGRALVLRSQLGVTDEQREEIKEVFLSHGVEVVEVAGDVTARKRALRDAVLAETPDERAIRARADELGKTIGDAASLLATLNKEVDPIWTERQRELLHRFMADKDQAVDDFLREIVTP